jgi:hypothetical protein
MASCVFPEGIVRLRISDFGFRIVRVKRKTSADDYSAFCRAAKRNLQFAKGKLKKDREFVRIFLRHLVCKYCQYRLPQAGELRSCFKTRKVHEVDKRNSVGSIPTLKRNRIRP